MQSVTKQKKDAISISIHPAQSEGVATEGN